MAVSSPALDVADLVGEAKALPLHHLFARPTSRFTHDYFYIRDETLGPMVVRVASFLPFQTTYYLNGHSFIEQELKRTGIGFRKHDNAFLAVADVAALQAAADLLSPEIIRRRLDYWTLILGPKFSKKERARLTCHAPTPSRRSSTAATCVLFVDLSRSLAFTRPKSLLKNGFSAPTRP
jgi:hypothetical protein